MCMCYLSGQGLDTASLGPLPGISWLPPRRPLPCVVTGNSLSGRPACRLTPVAGRIHFFGVLGLSWRPPSAPGGLPTLGRGCPQASLAADLTKTAWVQHGFNTAVHPVGLSHLCGFNVRSRFILYMPRPGTSPFSKRPSLILRIMAFQDHSLVLGIH